MIMFDNYFSATLPNYPPGTSLPASHVPVQPFAILYAVCTFYSLSPAQLVGGGKQHSKAKLIYRFLLHDEGMSCAEVARRCGVTRQTASESLKMVRGYLDVSDPWIADLWALKGCLKQSA